MSLPRALAPPATRACWRMPADKTLLEARGPFATYWDPVRDRPRESPTKRAGGGGSDAGGRSPRLASPRGSPRTGPRPSGGAGGAALPPPLGLSSLAPAAVITPGGGSATVAAAAASAAATSAAAATLGGGAAPPEAPLLATRVS
jgi:hypothetical protein